MTYLARPYHIPCDARQAIAYTMSWPPSHTIYHAVPTRPYHTPCHTLPGHAIYHAMPRQTIPYTICPPGHTICHTMPCQPGHTIYHAMPARLYHIPLLSHTIYYVMPARPYLFPCHARQATPYTMPFLARP